MWMQGTVGCTLAGFKGKCVSMPFSHPSLLAQGPLFHISASELLIGGNPFTWKCSKAMLSKKLCSALYVQLLTWWHDIIYTWEMCIGVTKKNLKSYNFLSKFTSLHWASVIAVPGCMCSQSVKIEKQACLYHRIIGRARGIVMLTGLRTMTQLLIYVPFCSWPAFFPLPIPQGVSLSVLSPRKIPLLHMKTLYTQSTKSVHVLSQ